MHNCEIFIYFTETVAKKAVLWDNGYGSLWNQYECFGFSPGFMEQEKENGFI